MDEAWKLFEGTGKVTDYLRYCRNREDSGEAAVKEQEKKERSAQEKEKEAGWDRMLY